MENAKLIFRQISAIMAEAMPITKARTNEQQNYKFRGIDDVMNSLQSVFQKHQVFIIPTVLESKREERTTARGGLLIYTIQKISFKFYAIDGSYVESIVEGEGMDSGDKSTNKAASGALKYALLQMLMIPTEEKKDSENDSPEPLPKQTPQKKKTASDKAVSTAVARIEKGETGIIEKMEAQFELTEEQLTLLKSAKAALPVLSEDMKEFTSAVEKIKAGKSSVEALKKYFTLTAEIEQKLNTYKK